MQKMRITIFFLSLITTLIGDVQTLDWKDPKWKWMDEQIEEEFRPFKSTGITLDMLNRTMGKKKTLAYGDNYTRLQIIDSRVYGYDGTPKELLKKIMELYPVPNIDVILFDHDIVWNYWLVECPVLATCKIRGATDKLIHFPVQLWTEWVNFYTENTEKICANSPWETKIPKIFWRGVPDDADNYNDSSVWTQIRRGKLCYLSQQFPELLNATFSGAHWWLVRHDLQPAFFAFFPPHYASWEEYLGHKYLIDLDGHVASNPGFGWKILSNCAVFKHDSRFTQWYYKGLVPWVHYIPVKEYLEDLFEKLQWAKDHDEEAKAIAENGRRFAKENMLAEHMYLYCYKVLAKYASLQKFRPKAL